MARRHNYAGGSNCHKERPTFEIVTLWPRFLTDVIDQIKIANSFQ